VHQWIDLMEIGPHFRGALILSDKQYIGTSIPQIKTPPI